MREGQDWRAGPWSDRGLGIGRGRALVSQGLCCGLVPLLSLAAQASGNHRKYQSENRCQNKLLEIINSLMLSTLGFGEFT